MSGSPAKDSQPRRSHAPLAEPSPVAPHPAVPAVRAYWNSHVHDGQVSTSEPGSKAYFDELAEYRYDKLRYLEALADFPRFAGRDVLEIGCGAGIDLARFAGHGASALGVELADAPLAHAARNLEVRGLRAPLAAADGAHLPFADASFDFVYCHGVLPYAPDPSGIAVEAHRVLRPGGTALFMAYHNRSWLTAMARLTRTPLEHDDAPTFKLLSTDDLERIVALFPVRRILYERFPVRSRLHGGLKGALFNALFVPAFRLLPKRLTRGLGWHVIAICQKETGAEADGTSPLETD